MTHKQLVDYNMEFVIAVLLGLILFFSVFGLTRQPDVKVGEGSAQLVRSIR